MSDEDPVDTRDPDDVEDIADGDGVDDRLDPDEYFEAVEVGDVDEAAVVEDVTGEGPEGAADADEGGRSADSEEGAVVPKDSYCRGCEHFSPPPHVTCGKPGTEIAELVDVDRFRVVNCPVVERRRGATEGVLGTDEE